MSYSTRSIRRGKQWMLLLKGRCVGLFPTETEAHRFADTDAKMRQATMDKSPLKVWEVPFTTTVTGTIKVLATSSNEAIDFLNKKVESGSFGFDMDNLAEEGILHDGSMVISDIKATDLENPSDPVESTDAPDQHPDWDAFDSDDDASDDEEEAEAETEGKAEGSA